MNRIVLVILNQNGRDRKLSWLLMNGVLMYMRTAMSKQYLLINIKKYGQNYSSRKEKVKTSLQVLKNDSQRI